MKRAQVSSEEPLKGRKIRGPENPGSKIRGQVLRSYIHPEIVAFHACSVRDNPRQARFPLDYCLRRIPLSLREITPPSEGGGAKC